MNYLAEHISWSDIQRANCITDGKITIGFLTAEEANRVTPRHSLELAKCYIDLDILRQLAENNGISVAAQLSELLPDAPHVRSGDFGEILFRQVLQESLHSSRFPVYRWRNRATKNDTVRGTDLIGYTKSAGADTGNDSLILCEVKTRAATATAHIVADAFKGVKKDYASRLAACMYFCQKRLLEDGLQEEAKALARFSSPHNSPYRKKLIAAVVHSDDIWRDTFLDHLPSEHYLNVDLEVHILRIPDLGSWIDGVYEAAPGAVEE